LLGILNVDPALDVLRLILAAWLTYAVLLSKSDAAIRSSLIGTGIMYLLIVILGLMNINGGGLFPSGLTAFDIIFHLTAGIFALWAAAKNENRLTASS